MTAATFNKPFAAKIAAAKQREAEAKQRAVEAAKLREEQAYVNQEPQQTMDPVQELRRFGNGFLDAVDRKVLNPNWSSEYMELISSYATGLLRGAAHIDDLPVINERHANQILDKFEYGVTLATVRGVEFPEDYFVGQHLLAQREEKKQAREANKVERIKIPAGTKPRGARPENSTGRAAVDLAPAITPKPAGNKRNKRKKR